MPLPRWRTFPSHWHRPIIEPSSPFTSPALLRICSEALVKPKFRQALVDLIKEAGAADGCPKPQGALLYTTASKVRSSARWPALLTAVH